MSTTNTHSHQAQVPTLIADYFWQHFPHEATHPVIASAFKPGRGWKRYPFRKRVSCSWLRKMRAEGYTAVAVCDGRDDPSNPVRVVDFQINAVLRHQNRPLRLAEMVR